jgi:hypothetical protein
VFAQTGGLPRKIRGERIAAADRESLRRGIMMLDLRLRGGVTCSSVNKLEAYPFGLNASLAAE